MLLLDLDPEAGLGPSLQAILEASGLGAVDLRRPEPHAGFDLETAPPLIFAVLGPAMLDRAPALLQSLARQAPGVPIVAVLPGADPDAIFDLLQAGVHDFLAPPLRRCDVLPRVRRLLLRTAPEEAGVAGLKEKLGLRHLVGESPAFLAAIQKIPLVARCDASVLISGETGTGKELFARAIHYLSPRSKSPFIAVNCGAIPTDLVENELFGHERSAYTGAATAQAGLIQEAQGGTLLLDEVDSLPLLAQVKLLRFLQEKEFRPLGSARTVKADVRVVAAANGDLEAAVAQGRFRQDLYYRLNVVPLALPALRERREDIPHLARHFLAKFAATMGQPALGLSAPALQSLLDYGWPGNVRELEHVIERAVVLSHGEPALRPDHVHLPRAAGPARETQSVGFQEAKARAVAEFEAAYIRELLVLHQGNISRAARAAEKNRRAFFELIKKHGIDVRGFRTPGG